uniref:hypothetical protein n=1 Tax=Neorhizobium sp. EC2-8 TaxID=3129230 RepID=UPI003100F803
MPSTLVHLTKAPFNLDREALDWVAQTFQGLDDTARAAQLLISIPVVTTAKRRSPASATCSPVVSPAISVPTARENARIWPQYGRRPRSRSSFPLISKAPA